MNEVTKLYENAEVKKKQNCSHSDTCYDGSLKECEGCNAYQYPPFTAEKQLNITKLIGLRYGLKFITNEGMDYMLSTDLYNIENISKQGYGYGYDEAIANLVNILWQDLTEEEKEQIRGILEC